MVFRLRDKSLYWTRGGWKNNYFSKVVLMPKGVDANGTAFLITRRDHHSYLRMVQSYRNYSRICKQYCYGDRRMEQLLQIELRVAFHLPFTVTTPVELAKHGAERRMADQLDRDYELMTYNYHPFQLFAYNLQNRRLREQNEAAEAHEKGQQTARDAIAAAFEAELANEQRKLPQGEKISLEKLGEVYTRVVNATRRQSGEVQDTKGPDGEYTDYLEKRRPFTEASDLRYSH